MTLKQCDLCKHFNRKAHTCPAFPEGIPQEIITYRAAMSEQLPELGFRHTKKHPAQQGNTVFEPWAEADK